MKFFVIALLLVIIVCICITNTQSPVITQQEGTAKNKITDMKTVEFATGILQKKDDKGKSSSNPITSVSKRIVQEFLRDIDNDGIQEKFIFELDESKTESSPLAYSNFKIAKITNGREEIIFDLEKKIEEFEGTYFDNNGKDLVQIKDQDKNGINEIYLVDCSNRPDISRSVVLEVKGNTCQVLFSDFAEIIEYKGVENNGTMDIVALTRYGQFSLYPSRILVYRKKEGIFTPSYKLTKAYLENELAQKELNVNDAMSLDTVLGLCAQLGLSDKGIKYIRNAKSIENKDNYIDKFKKLTIVETKWLENYTNYN